ncbi:MAG: hypothetical protein JOZ70_12250 [Pseudolabrys sp.]|nr:hypothetical protein [Pseudolabrys sp.]
MNGTTHSHHDVCWGAIIAGAAVACATTLLLLAFAVGGGLTVVSPWEGEGVSGTTVSWMAGIGLVAMAVISAVLGGYITGRMRHAWEDVHEHERYFRDTGHGLITWAVATLMTATVLAGAATHITAGASAGSIPAAGAGAAQAASSPSMGDRYVDVLLRPAPGGAGQAQQIGVNAPQSSAQGGDVGDTRAEVSRIIAPAMRRGGDVTAADRTYLAQVVSQRTGLPQAEAQQRVDQTITQAKQAADAARKAAAKAAMWVAASLLAGAFAGMLGAVEGGKLRNARWYDYRPTTTVTTVRT